MIDTASFAIQALNESAANGLDADALFATLQADYQQAQAADPFGADARLVDDLPRLNRAQDVDGLCALLCGLVAAGVDAATLTPPEAWAALRDLGFVMGAIKRWGREPTAVVPALARYLLALAAQANCLHPRDNVFTLTVANPNDARMRTYTGAPSERAFIEAVGHSMITMDRTLVELCVLLEHPLHSAQFSAAATAATATFQGVIDALLSTRTGVDPDWFANQFTRNLQPILVGGAPYHGPSADQTQMLVIDWLLYGQSYPAYLRFFHSLAQHLRPQHRQIMAWHTKRYGADVSLLDIVRSTHAQSMAVDAAQTTTSIESIVTLLKRIRTFRYPHRKIAIDSFAMRDENRQIGSGGLTPDSDLRKLIDWTEQAIEDFQIYQRI
ncbi:MAG: DUF1864 family protein [Caldilineaceae bacterium]